MYGALIGDTVGSKYEFHNIKTKEFPLFSPGCSFTDDSVMTAAVAKAILLSREAHFRGDKTPFAHFVVEQMRAFGRKYPHPQGAYGGRFLAWLHADDPKPYNSYGNGSAMRVSPCGIAAVELEEAILMARISARVTHNHPEGIKGAEAVAAAIYLAKTGKSIPEIREFIQSRYYDLTPTLDQIRPGYRFDESCQGTVPQAITAFLESESFEDALRNAVSIGGDTDTVAAITGSIAWTYYAVRTGAYFCFELSDSLSAIRDQAAKFIPAEFYDIARELWEVSVSRGGTYFRCGSCTMIVTNEEWKAEQKPAASPEKKTAPATYFQVNSGLMLKLEPEKMAAYRLHKGRWYADPGLFSQWEHGEIRGREVSFSDTYPTAPEYWDPIRGASQTPERPDGQKLEFCRKYLLLLQAAYEDEELRAWCREFTGYAPCPTHKGLQKILYHDFIHQAYAAGMVSPDHREILEKAGLSHKANRPTAADAAAMTVPELLACISHQIRMDYGSNGALLHSAIGEGYLLILFRELCSRA